MAKYPGIRELMAEVDRLQHERDVYFNALGESQRRELEARARVAELETAARADIIAALKRAFPIEVPPWGPSPDEELTPNIIFTASDGHRSIRVATFGEIADALAAVRAAARRENPDPEETTS